MLFNFLFEQIYKCATDDIITDEIIICIIISATILESF